MPVEISGSYWRCRGGFSVTSLIVLGVALIGVLMFSVTPALAAPEKPSVSGETVSGIYPFGATLEGVVNPNDQSTTYKIEYSAVEADLGKPEASIATEGGFGEETAGQPVGAGIGGLTPSTEYFYRIVATNETGTTEGAIEHFTTTVLEEPIVESEGVSNNTGLTAILEAQVNPNYQETLCEFQYGANPMLTTSTTVACSPEHLGAGGSATGASVALKGLQAGTTYYYRVVATNATGTKKGSIEHFTTLAKPVLVAGQPEDVTRTTVLLGGASVNPEGAATRYRFVYVPAAEYVPGAGECSAGKACAYEGPNGRSTLETSAGSESMPQAVATVLLSELKPGTTYDYALVATSSAGTTIGPNESFTTNPPTPPGAVSGEAVGIGQSAATITGAVNTHGLPTTEEFEFGSTPYGGSFVPVTIGSASGSVVTFSTTFNELQPGTTYYYRTVATNQDGTSYGAELFFTTPGYPSSFVSTPAPAFIPYTSIASLDATEAHENKTTATTTTKKETKKSKKKKKNAVRKREHKRRG
jgi:hypothetical protein